MKSIKVCSYSRSRSFHDDLILQDQASGEHSQDQWSSFFFFFFSGGDGGIFVNLYFITWISHFTHKEMFLEISVRINVYPL